MKTIDLRKVMSAGLYILVLLCLTTFAVAQAHADGDWTTPKKVDRDFQWLQGDINDCGPKDISGIRVSIQNGQTREHNYTITLQCRNDHVYTNWQVKSTTVAPEDKSLDNYDTPTSKGLCNIYGEQGNTIVWVEKQKQLP